MKPGRVSILLCASLIVCTAAAPARAHGGDEDIGPALGTLVLVGLPLALGATFANAVNLQAAARHQRQGNGGVYAGLIVGFLLVGTGLVISAQAPEVGLLPASYGALTCGIAGLAARIPIAKRTVVTVGPVMLQDAHGHVAPGLGLAALGW